MCNFCLTRRSDQPTTSTHNLCLRAIQLLLCVFVFYVCCGTDSHHVAPPERAPFVFLFLRSFAPHLIPTHFPRPIDWIDTYCLRVPCTVVKRKHNTCKGTTPHSPPPPLPRHRMTHHINRFNFFHLFFAHARGTAKAATAEDNDVDRQ